jgi:DNA-binding CsgD family transcriptional regulator
MARASWIDVMEAAYDMEPREQAWLQRIVQTSEPLLDEGLGVEAYTYDVSRADRVVIPSVARSHDLPMDERFIAVGIQATGPEYIRATYRSIQVETSSNTPGVAETPTEGTLRAMGIEDMLGINGFDPSGIGAWLGAALPRRTTLKRAQRARYLRIAAHLGVAFRLRRRLASMEVDRKAPWGADAVLSPRGALEHGEGDEVSRARERLRAAAVCIDRARGKRRRTEPDSALEEWLGLVDGRWSLVDKFDHDGKRYVLARRNEPRVGGLDALTERERAVAAYAGLGHTNKLIAHDLGIAHSTVRVLLARAAAKLGVRRRDQLVEAVRAATDVGAKSAKR